MKKKLMTLAVALSCAMLPTLFSSCVKDALEFKPEVTLPRDAEFEDGALLVPQRAGDFSLEIETSGEWRIESDRRFLRPVPAEGKGNATVTVSVQANQSDERKLGHLTIVFPGHEDQNKTITVEQAWRGDSVQNGADPISTSNKIYAVGYSYDCTGEYASPNSVKMEVFDTQALMNDGVLAVNAVQASLSSTIVSGSSISELTDNLAVKANISGGFGKFKAEAGASYDTSNSQSSSYEYASSYFDYTIRHASLSRSFETLKDDYMTDDAWNDINGIPVLDSHGIKKVHYPSPSENNTEGFRKLVEQYGTHVIVEAGLGGRLRHTMSVDISQISKSYDVKAFAKASYQGVINVGGSVDKSFSDSYEEYKGSTSIKVEAVGGDENLAKAIGAPNGFSSDNVDNWTKSVSEENMALVSFGDKSLVPLYELVERSATLENGGFDGQKRYEELKSYIDSGCSGDFSSYECGTVTKIQVPSFADKQNGGTLIQDVWLGGQWVGQVCEEFIPLIDMTRRVMVVYPVTNNKVRYNMGTFIGDEYHKPARVSWENGDYRILAYEDQRYGAVESLYLRGASVSVKAAPGTEVKEGTLKDEYLEAYGFDGNSNVPYNYPIVKIFDQIWTRTGYKYVAKYDFSKMIDSVMHVYYDTSKVDGYDFDGRTASVTPIPSGWETPVQEDYKAMMKKLEDSKIQNPGASLLQGGLTGFDVIMAGYYKTYTRPTEFDYFSNDKEVYLGIRKPLPAGSPSPAYSEAYTIRITNEGNVSYADWRSGLYYCARLIKK